MIEVALLAASSMVCQDIFEVLKDQSQARNRAFLAGCFDSLMYLALLTSNYIAITTLQGHKLSEKILVVSLVTVANFIGQGSGVLLGKRYIKDYNKKVN
jgi:hypothetical protein